jgi:hypothetical protein
VIPGLTYDGPVPQFEIVTEPGHGTGVFDWVVKGKRVGCHQLLFIGDPWECAHWARRQEGVAVS